MKDNYYLRHHRFFYWKHEGQISVVSRKTKKAMLGRKLNRKKLRERLSSLAITENKYPEPVTISDVFCPRCGCEHTRYTGNMAEYPEVWEKAFCLRCNFLVGMADNSPWVYALEFPEDDYEIGW